MSSAIDTISLKSGAKVFENVAKVGRAYSCCKLPWSTTACIAWSCSVSVHLGACTCLPCNLAPDVFIDDSCGCLDKPSTFCVAFLVVA